MGKRTFIVPRALQNVFDHIDYRNEKADKEASQEALSNAFQVIVYDTVSPHTKSRGGDASKNIDSNVSNYYYYRARSLETHTDELLLPEHAKSSGEYEMRRKMLLQAILKKNTHVDLLPQTGQVWNAIKVGGPDSRIVNLVSFEREGSIDLRFTEDFGEAENAHSSSDEPTKTNADLITEDPETSAGDVESYNTSGDSGPLPVVDATQRKLLDFISKGEGSYNASNNGTDRQGRIRNSIGGTSYVAKNNVTKTKTSTNQKLLSTMTIGEIQDLQKGKNPYYNPNASNKRTLFAVGAYQIIPATMPVAIRDSGLKKSDVFNEANQDKLGLALIYGSKRPKLRDYLKGSRSVTLNQAHNAFALEWASVPKPNGKTAYGGTGNKAGHTAKEVQDVLKEVRALNIKNGFTV